MTCKSLDITEQNLDSVPEYVYTMSKLEHVKMKSGNNIPVGEKYILLDTIPSIKTIDDQDVTHIKDGILRLNEIFNRRLDEMFLTKDANEIYNEESPEAKRQSKMIELAKNTIKSGPDILSNFRAYKVEKLIREHYDEFVSRALETIIKNKEEKENQATPSKRSRSSNRQKERRNKKNESFLTKHFQLQDLLRTHSKSDDPKDSNTKIWMCEFEPDMKKTSKTFGAECILATCGGDSICFIDCITGEVIKKYRLASGEEFYCIAWTILSYYDETENTNKDITMLAAAGLHGIISLIDPVKLQCYQTAAHHEKAIDALSFHPIHKDWLLSGAEDRTIVIWKLSIVNGIPKANKIATLEEPSNNSAIRQLAVVPHGRIVISACDDGIYAWNICKVKENKEVKLNHKYSFTFKNKKKLPLDSMCCLSDNLIGAKRVNEGLIHLFHSESEFMQDDATTIYSLPWRQTETPFLKFSYIKACNILIAGDDHSTIWLYDLNKILKNGKFTKHDSYDNVIQSEIIRSESENVTLFNHVTASDNFDYVVGVTDNNIVAIFKCQE